MLPIPFNLLLVSAMIGVVEIQFTGAVGVDHYDVYRSLDSAQVGSKINVNPLLEPVSPYTVGFLDDGINSIQAPVNADVYFYRIVAVDINGNVSLPSDSLGVPVNLPQEVTPPQAVISSINTLGN